MKFRKSREAAELLGVNYHKLINLIRFRKIDPPQRDSSGDYYWLDADIKRAKAALEAEWRARAAQENDRRARAAEAERRPALSQSSH